jgi:hypothetical protein
MYIKESNTEVAQYESHESWMEFSNDRIFLVARHACVSWSAHKVAPPTTTNKNTRSATISVIISHPKCIVPWYLLIYKLQTFLPMQHGPKSSSSLSYHTILQRPRLITSVGWYVIILRFIGIILVLWPTPTSGLVWLSRLLTSCSGSAAERCGFLNLSIWMHRGGAVGTKECVAECVFWARFWLPWECGDCALVSNAPVPSPGYDIYLDLVNVPVHNVSFFTRARKKWESVITGDLTDMSNTTLRYRPSSSSSGSSSGCVVPAIVDDVYICATYGTIDGPRRILGSAGPTEVRRTDSLTVAGEMKLDLADIYYLQVQEKLETVILHEMGHILGTAIRCCMLCMLLLYVVGLRN